MNGPHTDPCFAVNPVRGQGRRVNSSSEADQGRGLQFEVFTNSHSAVPNDPVIITQAAGMHGFVESGHRGDFRDWDEVAASAPADFSFHARLSHGLL